MIKKLFIFSLFYLIVLSQPLLAHSPISGIGNFYNGFLHPFFIPSQLMLVFANGLFLGQYGIKNIQTPFLVFILSITLALIFTSFVDDIKIEKPILILSMLIGFLIALNYNKSISLHILLSVLSGFLLGLDSTQEELFAKDKFLALSGSLVSIIVLSLYTIALSDYFNKKEWQKIVIRIFGSWISAASVMVLALSLNS